MEKVWADEEQEQEQPEQPEQRLLKLIAELRERQRALLEGEPEAEGQRALLGRLPELKQTIEAELAGDEKKQGREALLGIVENLEAAMESAAAGTEPGAVRQAQLGAFWMLDGMWTALAPFEATLEQAIEVQEKNLERTREPLDGDDLLGSDQLRVGNYAQGLVQKAQAAMQQAPAQGQGPQPQMPVEAFEKAIENGPRIAELSVGASGKLEERKFEEALPDEEEALRLLQEIREKLPDQDQQQQQQQQQPGKGDQQNEQPEEQEQGQGEPQEEPGGEPRSLTPEQIESMLRKAEEREREHREEKERRARALAPRKKVERDW
jgi:hypothetical protein